MSGTAISLFAGAGGLNVGVDLAGFRTMCPVESDQHCVSTLRKNGGWGGERKSVWRADTRTLDPERVAEAAAARPGRLALLHGGPPCQPFNQIGRREGMRDPRGRLVFEMVRFANCLKPTAIVVEQVPSFLRSRTATGMTALDTLKEEFLEIGYDLHASVLDAADFGVAQRRRRAILVCVPKDQDCTSPWGILGATVTVGDAIGDLSSAVLPGDPPRIPNHVDMTPDRNRHRISFVPEGQWLSKVKTAPREAVQRLTAKDSTKFRRVHRQWPSLTIRCGEALFRPFEDRYLMPRKSARIQGFPDGHVFCGPIRRRTGSARDMDQHRQVANVVPPPLAKAIARGVRESLYL